MSGDPGLDFNAPDGIEPVIGWRNWTVNIHQIRTRRLARSDLKLRSFNGEAWFPQRPFQAACMSWNRRTSRSHGDAPQSSCSCGVYAFKEIDSLLPWWFLTAPGFLPFMGPLENPADSMAVFGEVSLWGKIIVHEEGYRAQYAYPRRLWVDEGAAETLVQALPAYRVPVCTTRDADLHSLIESRLGFMSLENKDAAVAFLRGESWPPFSRCPDCEHLLDPGIGFCPYCDPEAADRELKRQLQELKRQEH
jgi:hypothetical protein